MGFDARVHRAAPDAKSSWDIAVENLATHHFKASTGPQESKTLAERFLKDSLHFMVNHQGKDEKTSRKVLASDFSNPEKIATSMRKYQMGGGF